jgi:hypothetical protein
MVDIIMANIRSADLNLLAVFDALFDARSVTRAAALEKVTVETEPQRIYPSARIRETAQGPT